MKIDVKFGSKLIAILIFLVMTMNYYHVYFALKIIYYLRVPSAFALIFALSGLCFLLLNAFAAVGLYRLRRWGFISAYVAILFSTFVFSVCYIPYFTKLFPVTYSYYALLFANAAVIGLVAYLHIKSSGLMGAAKKLSAGKRQRSKK